LLRAGERALPPRPAAMEDYAVPVDANLKATTLNLDPRKVAGGPQRGAHMRAFWASTISFFLAFVGWFALAPIAIDVAQSIGICENQLHPPLQNPKRKAYLKYKKADPPKEPYCTYGRNDEDDPTDCLDSADQAVRQAAGYSRYNPGLLPKCVCAPGTHCSNTILFSAIGSVAVTIFVRVALGTLLERFGPVNVQSGLMSFGAIWVLAATGIQAEWSFILIRTMIGCAGASFVTNQFWCSLMFAPNVVGTANATAAGWGNLGGGVTQVFIVWCLFKPFQQAMDKDAAWRVSMTVPGVLFLLVALVMKLTCWDTPKGPRFSTADTGKTTGASLLDYVACLKDVRVVVMIFQYSACFGTELAMNAQLATHFRTYFQMRSGDAAALASCFGLMNLFARSLGGIASDVLFRRFGFPGRLWAQALALFFEGLFLLVFGFVNSERPGVVRGPHGARLLLALRADGGGDQLRHRALHDPNAARLRLGPRRRRGQPGRRHRPLVFLQAARAHRHAAPLQGARGVRPRQRAPERGLLLARQGRPLRRATRHGQGGRGGLGEAGRGKGVSESPRRPQWPQLRGLPSKALSAGFPWQRKKPQGGSLARVEPCKGLSFQPLGRAGGLCFRGTPRPARVELCSDGHPP